MNGGPACASPDPSFERRIVGVFGDRGRAWLRELPTLVARYAAKWRLGDLHPHPEQSYAWIGYATSPCGPAVLKLVCPNDELLSEADALSELDASVVCRLLEDDRANGALLLERLVPGTPLRAIRSFDERVRVAANVLRRLHAESSAAGADELTDSGRSSHPRYLEQASRAFAVVTAFPGRQPDAENSGPPEPGTTSGNRCPPDLAEAARRGALYSTALVAADGPEAPDRLLHADLHHDNILRAGTDWRVIDPKGALGPLALEAGRFILNQYGESAPEVRDTEFDRMVARFAEALHVGEAGIAAGAALDATVSACWSLEDGESHEQIAAAGKRALAVQACADRWLG